MKSPKQHLLIAQVDKKIAAFKNIETTAIPQKGWVNAIRVALKMSLKQLGNRMHFSAQNIKQLEDREANGSITINSLKQVANALDMHLVYGFVSKHESLENMIEKRAQNLAVQIVMRTNQTMVLEDQQNSTERISNAIAQKTAEIKNEMPKYLWE